MGGVPRTQGQVKAMSELISLGSYPCTKKEPSSEKQCVVTLYFRNSATGHGGTGIFRADSDTTDRIEVGCMYEVLLRELPDSKAPKRFLRKRKI